ncbi:MAG: DEAD/DEAH box helicase [Bifidobacterium tibiigranuli]|jgi:DEAD/DEAH box helicase domain-containing protein|nr:DEAD/DEAH box helicase [Bifidobacterium tibiigranuli]
MIPIVLARHIRDGLADYMETTFPMTNAPFKGSIRSLARNGSSLAQSPFVSIKLPFRVAGKHQQFPFGECLHPQYRPYAHQCQAFERIAAGKSTLVATGTGSGKTECFLYPILDYCCQQRRLGRTGIKAVLVYPMNALASDQAKRLASLIYNSPELRNNVSAGMYVGQQAQGRNDESKGMSESSIVTSHGTLLNNPPDILLTNYKMLDYLLVRPEDSQLWNGNDPDTLRYFVVDELHTFDGAQGTDLACLLRRLTDRLGTSSRKLCCIGTSATMGSGDDTDAIRAYSSEIFNTTFDTDSVITEDRLNASEFFDAEAYDYTVPDPEQADELMCMESDVDQSAYLQAAAQAWLADVPELPVESAQYRLSLAQNLRQSRFLALLIEQISESSQQIGVELCDELAIKDARFSNLDRQQQTAAVDALIALVSYARIGTAEALRPFLNVQVQLWSKELRRIQASVVPKHGKVAYANAIELGKKNIDNYLPVINCRDCGGTAWIGFAQKDGRIAVPDLKAFYNEYFAYRPSNDLVVLQPCDVDATPDGANNAIEWFCNRCMKGQTVASFDPGECNCPECGTQRIPMTVHALELVAGGRKHYRCPFCASEQSLAIVGLRATGQIGVMLTQLSGDGFNDDDKSIVFSDSVQDASYRASAFNSRTWRFALRNSAMDYIRSEHKNGATLAEYLNSQNEFYRSRYGDGSEYIVRFIAPNMTWMREYELALAGEPGGSGRARLLDWIGKRLRLESLLEFGLRSRVGRTLEKSGCATLSFDEQKLDAVARNIEERCQNELGIDSAAIRHEDWIHIVAEFLDLLRSNGAFYDITYDRYLANDGNKYMLANGPSTKVWWMPNLYAEGLSQFLSDRPAMRRGSFDTFDSKAYRALADRYCSDSAFLGEIERELLTVVRDECVHAGFVNQQQYPSRMQPRTVYGLSETECRVSTDVSQLVCDTCGRGYSCATQNLGAWQGARCVTNRCAGRLIANTDETSALELSYYGKLYLAEPSPRIHAAEHTGLLTGKERTALEQQFKSSGRKPGAANVLACTPTLEMGIDIGDLSTVILSSIPPAQAQYIQRAGRAGRRDGNSLVLAVANTRPHDMYFYERPQDMLGGHVDPPHIFLDATAVLERQLTAYALDHWVHEMLQHGAKPSEIIPHRLRDCLRNVRDNRAGGFPANFFAYTSLHSNRLLDGFCTLFAFSDAIRTQLEAFMRGSADARNDAADESGQSMAARMYDVFQKTIDSIDELNRQKTELEKIIEDLKAKPDDSSYREQQQECEDEIRGVDRIITSVERNNTFNYLSDEGILPNYAFPESGVTLHTILKSDRNEDGTDGADKGSSSKTERREAASRDFVRPAASAITELAPGNTFYANGHKYAINRVLFSKGDRGQEASMWRLCPNCSHAEPASQAENLASCPSCGSTQWADNGQKRPMIRISTVISEERYSESQIDDSSDNRSSAQFVKDTLVDVSSSDVEAAWRVKKGVDFGFEYIPQGTIREINFGEAGTDGTEIEVAGDKRVRKGFNVCTSCGALANEQGYIRHAYSCPRRNETTESAEGSTCLFLYREVRSEILRMLVPGIADTSGDNGAAQSFAAAVMLGMRKKFGNVDHLNVTLSNEPLQDGSGLRKTYLVLYDTVPGGTGYLKQLGSRSDMLMEVLRLAFDAMDSCVCSMQPDADGCYNCIYAYRQSHDLGVISKQTAMDMIGPIVNNEGNTLVRIHSVVQIKVNKLFDSTLEQQFVEALGRLRANPLGGDEKAKGRRATLTQDVINGKKGYTLTINGSSWEVEPQVTVGPDVGVAQWSKPDFVLRPVTQTMATQLGGEGISEQRRPVAVFTDGLKYHAAIVRDDTCKREALRRAGYRVWTLTYSDVIVFLNGTQETKLADPAMDVNSLPGREAYRKLVNADRTNTLDPGRVSALGMLGFYLAEPDAERVFASQAKALSFAAFPRGSARGTQDSQVLSRMENALLGHAIDYVNWNVHEYDSGQRLRSYGGLRITEDMQVEPHIGLVLDDDIGANTDSDAEQDDALAGLNDDERDAFKQQWASFWHITNVMQFSDKFLFATMTGLHDDAYENLRNLNIEQSAISRGAAAQDWGEIFADPTYIYLSNTLKQAIERLSQMNIPAPKELGYELVDNEEIVGEVDLGWERQRIAFIPLDDQATDADNARAFTEQGWRIISEATEDVARLFAAAGKES